MPDVPEAVPVLLAVCTGLGLAAACGFRVFLPLLAVSLGARGGLVSLSGDFHWMGSTPALACFAAATIVELAAYLVPFLDNVLDALAAPAAVVAGAVVALATFVDVEPWLRWSLGIVAGGGLAAAVHVPTAAVRAGSTAATAGLANLLVAAGELVASAVLSALALVAPIAVPIVLVAIVAAVLGRRRRPRREAA